MSEKRRRPVLGRLLTLVVVAVVAVVAAIGGMPADADQGSGTIVVANRGGSSLTLIDERTDEATTIGLPAGENPAEPMYVVFSRGNVFVGDRANDRVLVIDPRRWDVIDEIPTGAGVFHMWASPNGRQLWVNNDIDNTITVINPRNLEVITTIDLPADLVAAGGRPHDVILDNRSAWVTMIGVEGDRDAVVRYSLRDHSEQARASVGDDPHVTIDPARGALIVAAQNANEIAALDRSTLERFGQLTVPATHGLDISSDGRVVYTTNITGGGTDALWALDTRTGEVLGEPVDSVVAVPHNIVLTADGAKLYLTHSGATADKVTVYDIGDDRVPVLIDTVDADLNPFGLEYVPGY